MIVLEMLGHLGEFATLAEAEDGRAFVDVNDTLMTHAE